MKRFSIVALSGLAFLAAGAAQAGDPEAGKKVWSETGCAACHGHEGVPQIEGVPSFSKGERLNKMDADLTKTIKAGTNIMPAWGAVLSDKQIEDVLAYIRTLPQ